MDINENLSVPGPLNDAHSLSDQIVSKPVSSRRYGITCGINILPPKEKRCDWNCLYCQLGYTDYGAQPTNYPNSEDVYAAILNAPQVENLSGFVICGNGEPTLHPQFPEVTAEICKARDEKFSGVPILCLTNGSELWRSEIKDALGHLDEVSVKLDAGSCDLQQRINLPTRPNCVSFRVHQIRRLHGAVIQSCFFEGPVTNADEEAISSWISAVKRAMPSRVDIYTIARDTPSDKLMALDEKRLYRLGELVYSQLGIPARVYGAEGKICAFPE
jgi:wyosine [tRNA(Phe)-imidazoG37] synthetase (radical SAM superfamily)